MLIFVPILLLLFGAITIAIIYRVKSRVGLTWLVAAGSSLVAWLIMAFMRLYLPTTIPLINWVPETLFYASPFLMVDYISWPYAISLITINIAFIFTDSARSKPNINPMTWAGSMSITAIGLMALLAGNPLTMVLAWALVDIVEFVYLLSVQQDNRHNHQITLLYASRLLSLIMFTWATMVGWLDVGQFNIDSIPARSGVYFLIAAALRLGIIPLNLSFLNEPFLKRGPSTLLRLAPIASSLSLIARMPVDVISIRPYWMLPLQVLIGFAALVSALLWLLKEEEQDARIFWHITLSSLAIICAINGHAPASRAWGIALLLSGSLLFLFDPPIKRLRFLLIPGLIGLIALPFTPASSGWQGLISSEFSFLSLVMIISHALLVSGYIKFMMSGQGSATGLESWSKISFPIGLIFILQTQIAVGVIGWPGVFNAEKWWVGLLSLGITLILATLAWRFRKSPKNLSFKSRIDANQNKQIFLEAINSVTSLEWMTRTITQLYRLTSNVILTSATIIEGEGGILWAFVFLILLLSFLKIGGF